MTSSSATPDVGPYGSPAAATYRVGGARRWFVIGLVALVVLVELFAVAGDEVVAGIGVGLMAAIACWLWAFVAWRYRLRVEDGRIWIRLVREHGPIHLDRVAAADYHLLRGAPRLELVQPDGGAPWVRSWATTMIPRRARRAVDGSGGRRLRTVTIGLGLLGHDAVLHELAPHLLAAPGIVLDEHTRSTLERFGGPRSADRPA